MSIVETKMRAGKWKIPVKMDFPGDGRVYFYFAYNQDLMKEIKNLQDRKWHGFDKVNPRKIWSAPLTERNLFTIDYLQGKNPYARYEQQLLNVSPRRELYKHQTLLFRVGITRKRCILAAEMGTGKTLAAIEILEYLIANGLVARDKILFCGTLSSLRSVQLELEKWKALVHPRLYTYDRLRKADKDGEFETWLPQVVIFDESSRLKNATAQRTIAAMNLASKMRKTYNEEAYIIEMTGSPSPKSPCDWWSQSEVVEPGFLSEPNVGALQRRLALMEQEEAAQGGTFPKLVTWLDDENKCCFTWKKSLGYKDDDGNEVFKTKVCGKLRRDPCHEPDELELGKDLHEFKKSINEVALLHKRLSGLVEIVLKKDCLDLPPKVERIIRFEPSESLIRTARMVVANNPRVISAMTCLRELSDGFLYEEKETGKTATCPECKGTTKIETLREHDGILSETPELVDCTNCTAGIVDLFARSAIEVDTPKEAQLIEDLEDHEDVGRLVVFAAFQGSIDRITRICLKQGWSVIQVDGRGWKAFTPEGPISMKPLDMLRSFQNKGQGKLVFVGHPGSAGMGLTLTASPTIIWWSLPFNGEDFIQASDRIHRVGCTGALYIYYFNLPTDELVYINLKTKIDLQAITLGSYISKEDIEKVLR